MMSFKAREKFCISGLNLENTLLPFLPDEMKRRTNGRSRTCASVFWNPLLLMKYFRTSRIEVPPTQPGVGSHCRIAVNPQDPAVVGLRIDGEEDRDPGVGLDVQRCQSAIRRPKVDPAVSTYEVERIDVRPSVAGHGRDARYHRSTRISATPDHQDSSATSLIRA